MIFKIQIAFLMTLLIVMTTGFAEESQVMGKNVPSEAPDFFSSVLSMLGMPYSDFANDALIKWTNCEATTALWNPLATTWNKQSIGKSWDFNTNNPPVQEYSDKEAGIDATTKTLKKSNYKPIVDMLKQEAFDEQGIRSSLETWGGAGYENVLVPKWRQAYFRAKAAQYPGTIGEWTLNFDFGCTGSPSQAVISFYDDGTFEISDGSSPGKWTQTGNTISWQFDEEPHSIYEGTIDGSNMEGTMSNDNKETCCWSADKRYYGTTETIETTKTLA